MSALDTTKLETKSLFEMIKEHILGNLNDENVPLLSTLSHADVDKFDVENISKALQAIDKFSFRTKKRTYRQRHSICTRYGGHLLMENFHQLMDNYNRIMENVRKEYPDFNLVQETHNRVFGKDVSANDRDRFIHEPYKTSLHMGVGLMLDYHRYSQGGYMQINYFLRGVRTDYETGEILRPIDLTDEFTYFAPNLAVPFYSKSDLVVYRADDITVSSSNLKTKGVYSTSLSIEDTLGFMGEEGRIIQINVPKGTPIMPILLERSDECEIALLPGTVLEKKTEMQFKNGHFAEYNVVENPPSLSELEEVHIFRNAITLGLDRFRFKTGGMLTQVPETKGEPTAKEILQFNVDLVNTKYDGDW